MTYARIIINIARQNLDHPFTYRVPQALEGQIGAGSLVQVPFGKGSTIRKGYVIELTDRPDLPEGQIKEILSAEGSGADASTADLIRLAAWMKQRYGSTMITALKTVLPPRRSASPVVERQVRLLLDPEEAKELLSFCRNRHQVARARLLEALIATPCQPYHLILSKLHVNAQTLKALEKKGVLRIESHAALRNPVSLEAAAADPLVLSAEQEQVVAGVMADYDRRQQAPESAPCVSLLHGITGSGKTEVYIRIIEEIVARGRQAIMLIPEIALTYQTLIRFYRHFGNRVSVMNSSLSESEKSDQAARARQGEIDVIIGPRSAVFTPFPDPGVIIIDEEHENSYKNESMPKYHVREVAAEIARQHRGVVVLGSATPSLDSYYHAEQGEYRLYHLTKRLTGGSLPSVETADMREELKAGNRSMLSRRLASLIDDRLTRGEQTMLFLNRRGFSGFVSCRMCGHVIRCPHCDVSLSLHRNGKLVCHYCGYEEPFRGVCPECGSKFVSGFHAGTEQVEAYLHERWPSARILRMDADTTARKGSYEKILSAFADEEADILVGTQMIVKGHDFPKVTLMGILMADLSLYANDYRASERTFQLLTQAAGRAGRGQRPGQVVIQTYDPDHYAIRYAKEQDYEGFYREEMVYRRELRYPPACHLLAVQIQSSRDDYAQLVAGRVRELLDRITAGINSHAKDGLLPVLIIGPAPASLSRVRDIYRYVVYIKCAKYDTLIDCKDRVEAYAAAIGSTPAGRTIRIQFDFDPVNPY